MRDSQRWKWPNSRADSPHAPPILLRMPGSGAVNMSARHKAREYALQMLFQWEIGRQHPNRIKDGFWRIARAEKSTRAFADALFDGTVAGANELDALVTVHSDNWRLDRMAVI